MNNAFSRFKGTSATGRKTRSSSGYAQSKTGDTLFYDKTGKITTLGKVLNYIYTNKGSFREDLVKQIGNRNLQNIMNTLSELVDTERKGRKDFYTLNENGKRKIAELAKKYEEFMNKKGIPTKVKTLFESYLEKAKEYNEDLSMAALDPETSKFMVTTLLQRIKDKKENTSVYEHLKKIISKWKLFEFAKKKIAELKLNPRILGLLGIK